VHFRFRPNLPLQRRREGVDVGGAEFAGEVLDDDVEADVARDALMTIATVRQTMLRNNITN
jgi:hypothetical protein